MVFMVVIQEWDLVLMKMIIGTEGLFYGFRK